MPAIEDWDRTDLIETVQYFILLAQAIADTWEGGDFAAAVTDLTSYADCLIEAT